MKKKKKKKSIDLMFLLMGYKTSGILGIWTVPGGACNLKSKIRD